MLFFILITVASALPMGNNDQSLRTGGDHMCLTTADVLCAKDVLMGIANVSENIERTTVEIEEFIRSHIQNVETFNHHVNFEMDVIREHLPKPQYHNQFSQLSNINKKDLDHLLREAHYVMSYFYNSIEDILHVNSIFASTIDTWFKQIQYNLENRVICPYRSVLSSYSASWPSINEVSRIQFSRKKYRSAPSRTYEVHSIIVAQLVREWMQTIRKVLVDLEAKFY